MSVITYLKGWYSIHIGQIACLIKRTVSQNMAKCCIKTNLWDKLKQQVLQDNRLLCWSNYSRANDVIWRYRSGSTLVQVIACCQKAPIHYLNQFWFMLHIFSCQNTFIYMHRCIVNIVNILTIESWYTVVRRRRRATPYFFSTSWYLIRVT